MKILLLNGVNMNMLGKRDKNLYGSQTLDQLQQTVVDYAKKFGVSVVCAQSNHEGALVTMLQQADCDGVILNAGAYSHYSYALRDCIECMSVPVAEVHMTDITARESFRHLDVLKDVCQGYFMGKGVQSYLDAVDFFVGKVKQ